MPFLHRSAEAADSLKKLVLDYELLMSQIFACRILGAKKIVVTIGSWDMLHIGHVRYLMRAKDQGDLLIVGVDSDSAVKKYKGPNRPIIPEQERREMLCYQSCVDFVTTVDDVDDKGKWQYGLLRTIRPDVFVAVEDSYPKEQCDDIQRFCGELIVLPRQAENTSSTGIIQNMIKGDPELMRHLMGDKE